MTVEVCAAIGGLWDTIGKIIEAAGKEDASGSRRWFGQMLRDNNFEAANNAYNVTEEQWGDLRTMLTQKVADGGKEPTVESVKEALDEALDRTREFMKIYREKLTVMAVAKLNGQAILPADALILEELEENSKRTELAIEAARRYPELEEEANKLALYFVAGGAVGEAIVAHHSA